MRREGFLVVSMRARSGGCSAAKRLRLGRAFLQLLQRERRVPQSRREAWRRLGAQLKHAVTEYLIAVYRPGETKVAQVTELLRGSRPHAARPRAAEPNFAPPGERVA